VYIYLYIYFAFGFLVYLDPKLCTESIITVHGPRTGTLCVFFVRTRRASLLFNVLLYEICFNVFNFIYLITVTFVKTLVAYGRNTVRSVLANCWRRIGTFE